MFVKNIFNSLKLRVLFKDKYSLIIFLLMLFCWYWFSFNSASFKQPDSTVLLDKKGELLGAKLSKDRKWRFPKKTDYNPLFYQAVVAKEEPEYWDNFVLDINNFKYLFSSRRGVESPISIKLIRIFENKKRTCLLYELWDLLMAIRLEGHLSKKQILDLYAYNLPFGSKTAGIEAASWQFFGKDQRYLTISEIAYLLCLADDSSVFDMENQKIRLLKKRNNILLCFFEKNLISKHQLNKACVEPIPEKTIPMPCYAPHFLEYVDAQDGLKAKTYPSYLNKSLQNQLNTILKNNLLKFQQPAESNAAVLVLDPTINKPVVYIGNFNAESKPANMDMIMEKRSAGGILNPLVYAAMLSSHKIGFKYPLLKQSESSFTDSIIFGKSLGFLAAKTWLYDDNPILSSKWLKYFGARSYYNLLKRLGYENLTNKTEHKDLSLLTKATKANLWRITCNYSTMVRVLEKEYFFNKKAYDTLQEYPFDASSIYLTFHALTKNQHAYFGENDINMNNNRVAFYFGQGEKQRDYWAIACCPEYTLGIWLGNNDEPSRNSLEYEKMIRALLSEMVNVLPNKKTFRKPESEIKPIPAPSWSFLPASGKHKIFDDK